MLESKLRLPLLTLRITVAIAMWIWVVDKFLNPGHTSAVWVAFYGAPEGSDLAEFIAGQGSYILGALQGLVVLAFTIGALKTVSYGLVLLMHLGSTVTSWERYLAPYDGANILFFAAFPMLGALIALFLLRDHDTLLAASGKKS